MLDLGTFGNTPAAIKLVEIAKEENISLRKSAKILQYFNTVVNELKDIDSRIKCGIINMVYEKCTNRCDLLNDKIKTYTLNVLNTKYKQWLVSENGQVPYKIRKTWR